MVFTDSIKTSFPAVNTAFPPCSIRTAVPSGDLLEYELRIISSEAFKERFPPFAAIASLLPKGLSLLPIVIAISPSVEIISILLLSFSSFPALIAEDEDPPAEIIVLFLAVSVTFVFSSPAVTIPYCPLTEI